jgi:hypothetical protein
MSRELVTSGNPITWAFLDRSFGGRAVELLKVSATDGTVQWSSKHDFAGGLTKAGAPVLAGNPLLIKLAAGHNGAFSVVLAGVKVGDKVASVMDLTAAPAVDQSAHFETTITVAGHIQQLNTDLSASTALQVTVVKQS